MDTQITAFILDVFGNDPPPEIPGNLESVYRGLGRPVDVQRVDGPPGEDLLTRLHRQSEGSEWVLIGHGDSAFYSLHECRRLVEAVLKYDNDWGFAENHPPGIVFDMIRRSALPVMENLRAKGKLPYTRPFLGEILLQDVNLFDLENLYSDVNLRTLRLSFFPDSPQDRETLRAIAGLLDGKAWNVDLDWNALAARILAHRHLLRVHPKYWEIETSTRCLQRCAMCPKTTLGDAAPPAFMDPATFDALVGRICQFSPKPVLALTGLGDAASHPNFLGILAAALAHPVAEVLVETSGADFDLSLADQIMALPGGERLSLIFSLDAVDPKLHAELRPGERPLSAFLETVEYLLLRRPANTWVQAVKMNENFEHLVAFHKHFQRLTPNIIIQKYNPWRGLLPERRLHPAVPFDRIDCWHLKRDLVIRVDGTVPVCKQDLRNEHRLGNAIHEDLETIWARGQAHFEKHLAGWEFCRGCDEHYTYNY
ncbi:MAG: spiro-SPASM protein [Spirochaetes bacterium]|nr:spiro-SPASM protein [Spirochaetota bacterium]